MRPKYFGVFDLTSGYYQAPLAEDSMIFTAFITCIGVYQWLRVPMGLKGAPAYFQQVMATIVLAGLIYLICEIYIDDVIVYANDEQTFLSSLEQVITHSRKYGLAYNPDKVKLGLSKFEYEELEIDSTVITFTVRS